MLRVIFLMAALTAWGCGDEKSAAPAHDPEASGEVPEGDVYMCPMKCKKPGEAEAYQQAEPGQCPVCGMDLEKQSP